MRPDSWRNLLAFVLLCLAAVLAACGGGGAGEAAAVPTMAADGGLDDPTVYSSLAAASLPGSQEAAAVTQHSMLLDGQRVDYTATAGHLIARENGGAQRAQASMFYVAYSIAQSNAAARAVTFFYNGGPGSATVWLQLGSYGPKRLVTGVPATTAAQPFALVDNADSLLRHSDLVFINAVGSGRSQAIAPFTNRSFWGVDKDAEIFRDFILRYLQANGRMASPKFLFGESYGGPRTAVLARRLQDAGVMLDGVVLQSAAMDYSSNCGVSDSPRTSCAGYLPSYAAVGAWHQLTQPVASDLDVWMEQVRAFTEVSFAPAVQTFITTGANAPALWQPLADRSGLPAARWQAQLNLGPTTYRKQLLSNQLIGRYDGRMKAPVGSLLAAQEDPSSTWIYSAFADAINSHLRDTLRYRNNSSYVVLSNAIDVWDFSHDGRDVPDTIPDLAQALAQNPGLRVLAINGYHDLATPFRITETDLARIPSSRIRVRNYVGGHMSYLDDGSRPQQRADLIAFFAESLVGRSASAARAHLLPAASRGAQPDHAGTLQRFSMPAPPLEPAFQAPLRDPWVPSRKPR